MSIAGNQAAYISGYIVALIPMENFLESELKGVYDFQLLKHPPLISGIGGNGEKIVSRHNPKGKHLFNFHSLRPISPRSRSDICE
jgi:hypothetical protein